MSAKLTIAPETPSSRILFAEKSFSMRDAVMFSVVRNPFVRLLSAYLSKIGKRNNSTWRSFCYRFQLNPLLTPRELSFSHFLRIIAEEPDELLDRHFAPQYMNLLLPFSSPRFVGRVEGVEKVGEFLSEFRIPFETRRPHTTDARNQLIQAYSAESIEWVKMKYADDFRLFGYSTDIECINDYDPQPIKVGSRDLLMDWIATGEMPMEELDPAQQAFEAFEAETDANRKLACMTPHIASDDNWSRLETYAQFVRSIGDEGLLQVVVDRITVLKSSHVTRGSCPMSYFREYPRWSEFAAAHSPKSALLASDLPADHEVASADNKEQVTGDYTGEHWPAGFGPLARHPPDA